MTELRTPSTPPSMGTHFTRLTSRALLVAVVCACPTLSAQAQKSPGQPEATASNASSAASNALGTNRNRSADFVVAVVNSEPVTNNEVRTKIALAERALKQQGSPVPARSQLLREVLERIINDKAQLQQAIARGNRVDESAVDNAVMAIAQQNQLTIEQLRRKLESDGISYTQFRSEVRDEVMVTRFRQRELESRVTVTEQDVDQFLRAPSGGGNPSAMDINLAQILITVPENASADQLVNLQARAQQAAERARAGGDFAVLVNEFSDAPNKADGGQMGLRNAERYPSLFAEATLNVRAGAVVGPLRSGAGFHVLKVMDKRQSVLPGMSVTQTHARHILLRVSPRLSEAMAQTKLADFKKRIAAGQDTFAALAREHSEDGSAKEGGDLGWSSPGQFVPEFEDTLNKMSAGQVSEPLVSRFGVHLIQVLERRESKLSARDQRELARNALREKKQEEAYVAWAQEIRGRAYVEYRDSPQ